MRPAGWLAAARDFLGIGSRQVRPRRRPFLLAVAGRCACGRQAEPGSRKCRLCGSWLEGYLSQPDTQPGDWKPEGPPPGEPS